MCKWSLAHLPWFQDPTLSPKPAENGPENDLEAPKILRPAKGKDPDLSTAIASLEDAVKQLTNQIVRRQRFVFWFSIERETLNNPKHTLNKILNNPKQNHEQTL